MEAQKRKTLNGIDKMIVIMLGPYPKKSATMIVFRIKTSLVNYPAKEVQTITYTKGNKNAKNCK